MLIIENSPDKGKTIMLLVKMVKSSSKFRDLDDALVEKELRRRFRHHPSLLQLIQHKEEKHLLRNSRVKHLVRGVRSALFPVYSMYYGKQAKKKYGYLNKLRKRIDEKDAVVEGLHRDILHCHASTRERLGFYEELYREIFEKTGMPKSMLDLGCGLNPFSLPFMKARHILYIASDFSRKDCDFVQEYFDLAAKKYSVQGRTACIDLLDDGGVDALTRLPAVDVCFLFKVADVLERRRHKQSERVITSVHAKFLIVSFSTKTLSGEKMDRPKRRWFEMMLTRVGYPYEIIEKKNEIFYVVKKH